MPCFFSYRNTSLLPVWPAWLFCAEGQIAAPAAGWEPLNQTTETDIPIYLIPHWKGVFILYTALNLGGLAVFSCFREAHPTLQAGNDRNSPWSDLARLPQGL